MRDGGLPIWSAWGRSVLCMCSAGRSDADSLVVVCSEGMMTQFAMTIGGELRLGEATFPVKNPSTGDVFAHAPACSRAELDRAMDSAQSSFREWSRDETRR